MDDSIKWISANRAMGLLKIGPAGMRRLIEAGSLSTYRVPGTGRLFVDAAEVEKLRAAAFQPAKVKAAG